VRSVGSEWDVVDDFAVVGALVLAMTLWGLGRAHLRGDDGYNSLGGWGRHQD